MQEKVLTEGHRMVLKARFSSSRQCELEGGDRRGKRKEWCLSSCHFYLVGREQRVSQQQEKVRVGGGGLLTRALSLMHGSPDCITGLASNSGTLGWVTNICAETFLPASAGRICQTPPKRSPRKQLDRSFEDPSRVTRMRPSAEMRKILNNLAGGFFFFF